MARIARQINQLTKEDCMFEEGKPATETPKRDLNEVFDLDRKKLTRKIVDQMEQAMRDIDAAREDLKAITASAKEASFGPRDVKAMQRIAKLRKDDKGGAAKEELEALERIGEAVGFSLFAGAAHAE